MPSTVFESKIFRDLLSTEAMRLVFSDEQLVARYIEVEIALARVQARLGMIPEAAALAIGEGAKVEIIDLDAMGARAEIVGYPILPLVEQIVAKLPQGLGEWVHWGATTQDIMDTGLVLQLRQALALIEADLRSLADILRTMAKQHRDTPMAGRSHMQQALPITFGYKVAVWLSGIERHLRRLHEIRPRVLIAQFAGAAGTLASLGEDGFKVQDGLAHELGLGRPEATWHVMRDSLAEVVCFLGLVTGTLAKIAVDITLMVQSEVAEAREPFVEGRGSSSTMPQKRNPIASEVLIVTAAAVRQDVGLMLEGMLHDHERASGAWQMEWIALPRAFIAASGALKQALDVLGGLEVDAAAMQRNLDLSRGLIVSEAVMMGLGAAIGRQTAHDLVYDACREAAASGKTLLEVLQAMPEIAEHISGDELVALCDPANYTGLAGEMVDRVVGQG
ncbi:MAG: adenylosuccinate lyase family protein [Alphaproteobacteria bacterium]|jgi:3-carboxy-cis,cis-muconate cycloisomerase|nr:adenylosuccinate lyase family protein [Alphaproteobacteria bacterium]